MLNFGSRTALEGLPPDLKVLKVVGQPISPDDIVDSEDHLKSAYGTADRTLVLIRPDGYIALISDAGDASAVSSYLAAIGM